jgi:Outer membrane protein beta-barrel domain
MHYCYFFIIRFCLHYQLKTFRMKKLFISLTFLFTIIVVYTTAQNGKLNFIIYGGLSSPKLSYKLKTTSVQMPTIAPYNGFTAGVRFATVGNDGPISMIGAAEYQSAGAVLSNSGIAGVKEKKVRINYLGVNTMVGIGFGPKKPKMVEFQIGLAASYAVSGQSITSYTNGADSTAKLKFGDSKASGNSYRNINFGLKTGLSFNISKLNIAAYYLYGFSDISIYDNVTIKNKGFNITLGYTVNIMSDSK